MSIQALTMPLDITWQRFGYSRDMIDTNFGDLNLPPKWRSSMAVYSYVVPEEQTAETYPDARIVYLRITCSITGWNIAEELINPATFSENGDELDDLQASIWEAIQSQGWANTYWPCLGAIAQIAIYPHESDDVGPDDFPYILDFEPKKRELYETRSESGEFLSGSTQNINIQKGTTTTDSTEESDILTGFGGGGGFSVGPISGDAKFHTSGEWGTRKNTSTQSVDMKTTDSARERRETTSFSTTFSQMYQLFNGYHLGTNRAVFLISPRPHTVSSPDLVDFNLINGQRKLEGIQDMFLVVHVPKKLKGLSFQANLDTGHTVTFKNGIMLMVAKGEDPPGLDLPDLPEDDDDPFPPLLDADFNLELSPGSLNPFTTKLLVTRRIIRNGGLFSESEHLKPTGAGDFPDESQALVVHEEPVNIGIPEKNLVKMAKTVQKAKNLIADQRNRFQKRVMNSMLSGFTAGNYKARRVTETKAFEDLTKLTLSKVSINSKSLTDAAIISPQDVTFFNKFGVKKIGDFFNTNLDTDPDLSDKNLAKLNEVREKLVKHTLKPAKKIIDY